MSPEDAHQLGDNDSPPRQPRRREHVKPGLVIRLSAGSAAGSNFPSVSKIPVSILQCPLAPSGARSSYNSSEAEDTS